jgi:hypothetical protein
MVAVVICSKPVVGSLGFPVSSPQDRTAQRPEKAQRAEGMRACLFQLPPIRCPASSRDRVPAGVGEGNREGEVGRQVAAHGTLPERSL